MSKKKSNKKFKRRDKYIEYFDLAIFDKLVNIKDLSYEEILVLEEEMKNNLFFSTNSEFMSYLYKEKKFREFKMNNPDIPKSEMYFEFSKVYKKRKDNKK